MILTLNLGSSSIKYAIFDKKLNCITKGNSENIKDHQKELQTIIKKLKLDKNNEKLRVVHRVVHGGEMFKKPTVITTKNIQKLADLNKLAPLHNPINTKGIEICLKFFPKATNIAVFDTSFHQSMTPKHFLYAIPSKYYKKYGIRRYGFHGSSHQYLRETYKSQFAPKTKKNHKIITCHLGNGSSIALIHNGKVIETSMGFTPLQGLIMGTRCGDIDPAILPFLAKAENLSPNQLEEILNKKSGLLALSEQTNDMKTLLDQYKIDPKSKLAVDMFVNSVIKYIGAYSALANGVDAIIFSGGIGEKSKFIRNKIQKNLTYLGDIDYQTIPTNEELTLAKESKKTL